MVILVFGAGGHARTVISILKEKHDSKDICIFDKPLNPTEQILGVAVRDISFFYENISKYRECEFIISIGDNSKRKETFDSLLKLNVVPVNLISVKAEVDESSVIGRGNCIAQSSIVCSEVKIGSNNIINTDALIEHEVIIGNHNHISPKSCLLGRVKIGNNVLIGAGAVIKDNVEICDDVVIGANATVVKDISEAGIYIGTPVKKYQLSNKKSS
jgi:sugar O-acyltransferase (sialic acid O-acetyltransferase NeuD family)